MPEEGGKSQTFEEVATEKAETEAPTIKLSKPEKSAFNLIEAIKTLQKLYLVDPLAKQEFES